MKRRYAKIGDMLKFKDKVDTIDKAAEKALQPAESIVSPIPARGQI
jgi:hypothetical protein